MRRRDMLRRSAAATVGGMLGVPGVLAAAGSSASRELVRRNAARNVIFLALDGTGYEDLAAARFFSERVVGRPLRMERFLAGARSGSMLTHSLTSVVTDSAAASSAWSTGRKLVNYYLSQFPGGVPLTTISELARAEGRAVGLVTTTRMTHATPAAWIARVANRGLENQIAAQYLDFAPDVLLGGGSRFFEAGSRPDGRDLLGEFRSAGHEVVTDRDALLSGNGSRLLGLFTPGDEHLPFEVDRRFQGYPAPSLAEMTRVALERLSGSDRGFLLQVEAGRIDHANHQNDPGAMIWDWIAADEALEVILDFMERDGETLLVLGADHDTGGGVVYGYGSRYLSSTGAFTTLERRRASHQWLIREVLPPSPSPAEVREAAREYLGVPLAEPGAEAIAGLLAGTTPEGWRWGHRNAHADQPANAIAHILSEGESGTVERPNLSFATGNHTAGWVPVALHGAGVTPGGMGIVDNTDLFGVMTAALGIEFENPSLTEQEALEALSDG